MSGAASVGAIVLRAVVTVAAGTNLLDSGRSRAP